MHAGLDESSAYTEIFQSKLSGSIIDSFKAVENTN